MTRMRILPLTAAVVLSGAGLLVVGCHNGHASDNTGVVTPATQPNTVTPVGNQGSPPEPPVAVKPPDPASMTHVLTKAEPWYASMPGADAKARGELSKGTKVLVLVPGPDYSKVLTEQGNEVYAPTDGLEPITKK